MDDIHVDLIVLQLVEEFFRPLLGLNKDEHRWCEAFLERLAKGHQLGILPAHVDNLLGDRLSCGVADTTLDAHGVDHYSFNQLLYVGLHCCTEHQLARLCTVNDI